MFCLIRDIVNHYTRSTREVYLDHNATTPMPPSVCKRMKEVMDKNYGNPSSPYRLAKSSAEILEQSRESVALAIGAQAEEITFTSCASESNNSVLKGLSRHFFPEKKKIISTPIEHPSIMETLEYLKAEGIEVIYCPIDKEGKVLIEELEKLIDKDTFLICCMLANNEIGTIQDVKKVSAIAHKHGTLMMSDCVQALGKIPVDVKDLDVDYASFSAHKLGGPKGIGALYIREGSVFTPLIHGGHQEEGYRAGTESIHNIAGFAAACDQVGYLLAGVPRIQKMKHTLEEGIKEIYPKCIVHSPESDCLSNTLNISFPGISNTSLIALLDYHGIAASGGSACSMPENKASHVLSAIGMTETQARETLRLSLGAENSMSDIKHTLSVLRKSFKNGVQTMQLIAQKELDEEKLFDKQTFIVDVRTRSQRKQFPGLPGSHEVSYFGLEMKYERLPKDKNIIVVCQRGNFSYLAAFQLRTAGFKNVSSLATGIGEWKKTHPALYEKHAGRNIRKL